MAMHVMYDMHDVFTIVVPQCSDSPSIDVNTDYGDLTMEQVATSNE